ARGGSHGDPRRAGGQRTPLPRWGDRMRADARGVRHGPARRDHRDRSAARRGNAIPSQPPRPRADAVVVLADGDGPRAGGRSRPRAPHVVGAAGASSIPAWFVEGLAEYTTRRAVT